MRFLILIHFVCSATIVIATLTGPPVALAQADPATVSGPSGSPSCSLGPLCGIGDIGAWLQQAVEHVLTDFLTTLASDFGSAIVAFVNDVNFITRTPENLSYNQELVRQFATATQVLADGLLAVVVLVGGFNIMLRPHLGTAYTSARELLPRLLLGAILVNTASWWCRLAIDVNNAACVVFGAPTIADIVSGLLHVAGSPIAGVLMVLIVVVMTLLLVIQQLMRLALVDALLILAPVAAALWVLPQSRGWGQLWGRLFIGTVFAQCIQVLTLRLGFNLATGLPQLSAAGLLQPVLGIAVLALALKIPGLLRGGAGGGSIVSDLLGTAAGAAIGTSVGVGVRSLLGAGTRAASRPVSARASSAARTAAGGRA